MRIDSAGLPFIGVAAIPAVVAAVTGRRRVAVAGGVLALGVTAFFRDPDRRPETGTPIDPDVVIAPADGKVMHAGPPEPGVAPPGDWQQISIFLSLADVHINRAAYGGRVADLTYQPGRFLAAFKAQSALENERSEITVVREVDGTERTVVFRQIVGLLARRVVTRVEVGDTIATGARIGLMKFGSRMDIFVPPETAVLVTKGARVTAGETALARWRRSTSAGSL